MSAVLWALFFLSGAAGLLFETLWFRLAGLSFGNSVWSSSLVLSSFMAGLSLGNLLVSRRRLPLPRPLRFYAALEIVIGGVGVALVFVLPGLGEHLAPLFRHFLASPALLNALRLLSAFLVLMLPATAMGATLPVLVRGLTEAGTSFERALGGLYGWNTLGAMAGALAGETLLIGRFGLRGTGCLAALLNLTAASLAYRLSRDAAASGAERAPEAPAPPTTPRARRLLAAAFLCGAILLSLEVVWFRFLMLFVQGTSLAFAVMLSVVLLGVAAGGLLASRWLSPGAGRERYAPHLALAAGALLALLYGGFGQAMGSPYTGEARVVFVLSAYLMLPVCALSGALFTCLGVLLKQELHGERQTAARLTVANTLGSMVGPLAAGFVLLPRLGMEVSFAVLAAAYGAVAWLVSPREAERAAAPRRERLARLVTGLAFATVLALFPFGLMRNAYLRGIAVRYAGAGGRIALTREGLTETIVYLRHDFLGQASYYRLLTNGLSMSSSHVHGRRYMKLFVYLPVALHPAPESALLISYGVGSTARALADTASLRTIDIVDISKEIVEASRVVFPRGRWPPDDPRVSVHIEDGRFFLLTTDRTFDLITGEPPPPKYAGISNLYSREYFTLMRRRLAPGGMATYWLPVYQLEPDDSRAIVAAFCSAFGDCSLWRGAGPEWMLLGTRDAAGGVSAGHFAAQWADPVVGPEMRALGLEGPEQLGTLFLGDASFLARWAGSIPPLEDDHPLRVSTRSVPTADPSYYALESADAVRKRFEDSALVQKMWPPDLRQAALSRFGDEDVLERQIWRGYVPPSTATTARTLDDLVHVLAQSDLRTLPLWLMGSDADEQRIVDALQPSRRGDPVLAYHLGVRALVERSYPEAAARLEEASRGGIDAPRLAYYRYLALCLAGDAERAANVSAAARGGTASPESNGAWDLLEDRCHAPRNPPAP